MILPLTKDPKQSSLNESQDSYKDKSPNITSINSIIKPNFTGHITSSEAPVYFKFLILSLLCLHNAGHALLTRYSQGILRESYSSTEVVLFGEVLKLIVSALLVIRENASDAINYTNSGYVKLLWLIVHSKKIIVLVILYSIGNVLSYYALARVEAAVYTVTNQLKIFTTAIFSVIFLGKQISGTKWRALCLLVVACILVTSPTFNRPKPCAENDDGEMLDVNPKSESSFSVKYLLSEYIESLLGVGAILVMTIISGYSAIYFEGMLKQETEKISIWERNFQLAFFSTIFLVIVILWDTSGESTKEFVFFEGWTFLTVILAVIQALGGLLVAACLKYADAILKVLATAGSIVFSSVLGYLLLGGSMDLFVVLGAFSTILAIVNYTLDTTTS